MRRTGPQIGALSNRNDTLSNAGLTLRLYGRSVLNEPHTHTSPEPADLVATEEFAPLTGRARCADGSGALAHLFFSDDDLDVARAKAICRSCSLRTACFEGALARREAYGVWGGILLIDGEPTRFPRRRGRPPEHRIETVAEEVPIPAHLVA